MEIVLFAERQPAGSVLSHNAVVVSVVNADFRKLGNQNFFAKCANVRLVVVWRDRMRGFVTLALAAVVVGGVRFIDVAA